MIAQYSPIVAVVLGGIISVTAYSPIIAVVLGGIISVTACLLAIKYLR